MKEVEMKEVEMKERIVYTIVMEPKIKDRLFASEEGQEKTLQDLVAYLENSLSLWKVVSSEAKFPQTVSVSAIHYRPGSCQ